MRHLLALLDDGTHGTPAGPASVALRVPQNSTLDQRLARVGTRGTLGTPEIEQVGAHDTIAQRVADLANAWHERMAICLEAGDISEAEAEITAALEVGRAFVRYFVQDDEGRGWLTCASRPKSQGLAADVIGEGDVARQQQE